MKYKKLLCTVLVGTMIATTALTTGCGNTSTIEATAEVAGENTITFSDDSYSETSFSGTVEGVDGNTITLTLMSGGQGGAPSMPSDGQGGEAPSGDGTAPSGDAQGTAPSGDAQGTAPSGDAQGSAPSGDAQGTAPSDSTGAAQSGDAQGSAPSGDSQGSAPSGDANGQAPTNSDGTVPEKPDGDTSASDSDAAAPSGDASSDGSAPSMPTDGTDSADAVTATITINDTSVLDGITLDDIAVGTMLSVELDEDGNITKISTASMGMGGQSSGVDSYDSLEEVSEDATLSGETYASTGTDENAILVTNGATATISNCTISRDSDDSTGGDNSSFYGVGAAVLVTDGTATVENSNITTDAAGGAGVFAYGDGVAYVNNCTIKTTQNTSGGIHVAGGGTLYATDCTVETNGESAAAVRSDRGGGTMTVNGGSYTSNGTGSPAVYCTANIDITDADLTATGSEAVCIEGLNSLTLTDCNLTGSMPENEQNDCTWNVIVYQSMSGDSEVGNGTFSMTGGTLTAKNGGMFYTTNTDSTFYLSGVDITYASDNAFFLKATGNSNARGWGQSGANGAQCTFTADDQEMEGDVIYDSISTLDFYMNNGSTLTGAVIDDESNAGNGGDGYCNFYIDKTSTWIVTGDSTLTSLSCEGKIVDASGKTVTIKGSDGTVYVKGTSSYTITVDSYSTSL